MSSLPKYQIDQDVTILFRGKVKTAGYNINGKLEYKISDEGGNNLYILESSLHQTATKSQEKKL
jgi:hypothetical protein